MANNHSRQNRENNKSLHNNKSNNNMKNNNMKNNHVKNNNMKNNNVKNNNMKIANVKNNAKKNNNDERNIRLALMSSSSLRSVFVVFLLATGAVAVVAASVDVGAPVAGASLAKGDVAIGTAEAASVAVEADLLRLPHALRHQEHYSHRIEQAVNDFKRAQLQQQQSTERDKNVTAAAATTTTTTNASLGKNTNNNNNNKLANEKWGNGAGVEHHRRHEAHMQHKQQQMQQELLQHPEHHLRHQHQHQQPPQQPQKQQQQLQQQQLQQHQQQPPQRQHVSAWAQQQQQQLQQLQRQQRILPPLRHQHHRRYPPLHATTAPGNELDDNDDNRRSDRRDDNDDNDDDYGEDNAAFDRFGGNIFNATRAANPKQRSYSSNRAVYSAPWMMQQTTRAPAPLRTRHQHQTSHHAAAAEDDVMRTLRKLSARRADGISGGGGGVGGVGGGERFSLPQPQSVAAKDKRLRALIDDDDDEDDIDYSYEDDSDEDDSDSDSEDDDDDAEDFENGNVLEPPQRNEFFGVSAAAGKTSVKRFTNPFKSLNFFNSPEKSVRKEHPLEEGGGNEFTDEKWQRIEHEHHLKQLQHQRDMQALRNRHAASGGDGNKFPPVGETNTAKLSNDEDAENIYSRYYIPGTLSRQKQEELGTMDAVKETHRTHTMKRIKTTALANAHVKQINSEASCHVPQRRVVRIQREPSKIYMPHCTVLHRCGDDTGCCRSERQTCAPKRTKSVDLHFFVKSINDKKGTIERLTFVNHTECHCVDISKQHPDEFHTGSSFGNSPSYFHNNLASDGQMLRHATILNCNCPNLYEKILQEDGFCRCDCSSGNTGCDWLKRGMEHFSMIDRKCIIEGRCKPPTCEYGAYMKKHGRCPRREEQLSTTLGSAPPSLSSSAGAAASSMTALTTNSLASRNYH